MNTVSQASFVAPSDEHDDTVATARQNSNPDQDSRQESPQDLRRNGDGGKIVSIVRAQRYARF